MCQDVTAIRAVLVALWLLVALALAIGILSGTARTPDALTEACETAQRAYEVEPTRDALDAVGRACD